jgi:hypothetical protein
LPLIFSFHYAFSAFSRHSQELLIADELLSMFRLIIFDTTYFIIFSLLSLFRYFQLSSSMPILPRLLRRFLRRYFFQPPPAFELIAMMYFGWYSPFLRLPVDIMPVAISGFRH